MFFVLCPRSNKSISDCFTAIPLLFHMVFATVQSCTILRNEQFCILLISAHVLSYQPSCHSCSVSCWYQPMSCLISHNVTAVVYPADISPCPVLSAIMSQLFCILLISAHVLSYQPSCHSCSVSCWYQPKSCLISHHVTAVLYPADISPSPVLSAIMSVLQLMTIFKFVVAKIFVQYWLQTIIAGRRMLQFV
jgi:hypothetical protein